VAPIVSEGVHLVARSDEADLSTGEDRLSRHLFDATWATKKSPRRQDPAMPTGVDRCGGLDASAECVSETTTELVSHLWRRLW
jgi:hypothetical protein